ncbi:MAG: flagellar basal body rod protein FlgB [Burkholderiaceae bacterium]|nr:MAG: flagellar basal body rod protein FlgB [Burkholderiaceae bacterium]
MIGKLNEALDFQAQALRLRAERQSVLAANIANADTPNYKAVDFNFAQALQTATNMQSGSQTPAGVLQTTSPRHISTAGGAANIPVPLQFRADAQSSLDANSVNMDVERANFADNAIRYEAALRALNQQLRTLQSAVQNS